MAVISNASVYNYLMSVYGSPDSGRYDSHKKSELKDVYNRMVRANKESPLYKIDFTPHITEFAIDLKESARRMSNVVASLGGSGSGIESVFHKKSAASSNEDAVSVEYVGKDDEESEEEGTGDSGFSIEVRELARPQVNRGHALYAEGHGFESGTYSFDLDTNSGSYEFQFNVGEEDTNKDVQSKIMRLINTSNVGLNAEVSEEEGLSTLTVTSKQTGLAENEKYLFRISSGASWNELNLLGIGEVTSPARSSTFILNDKEHHSLSNSFTINHEFELTLKKTTGEEGPAVIGFKANADAIADSVTDLMNSYNGFVAVGKKYSDIDGNRSLLNEVTAIGRQLSEELRSVGLSADDSGMLRLDRSVLEEAVTGEDNQETFRCLNIFKDALYNEACKTSTNPPYYVNKVTVEYKNPGRTFAAPYASSAYSGMLVDCFL